MILTLPALVKVDINGAAGAGGVLRSRLHRRRRPVPGLRDPDLLPALEGRDRAFKVGNWNLGSKLQAGCALVAVVEIIVTSVIALLPTSAGGVPVQSSGFAWKYVNYTPIVVHGRPDPGAVRLLARSRSSTGSPGPVNTLNEPENVG